MSNKEGKQTTTDLAKVIGLIFLLALVGVGVTQLMAKLFMSSTMEMMGTGFGQFGLESGLIISHHKQRKIEHGVVILAQVENTGEKAWSSISVEVELFDKQGEFVDECSSYLNRKLKQGEQENLKIKCGGCKDNPLPAFDHYTIQVKNAYPF